MYQELLQKVAEGAFEDELQKISAQVEVKEKKKPGWGKKFVGMMRAGSITPTKVPIPIPHPELLGKGLLGGLVGGSAGAGAGAGVGALVGLASRGRISPKDAAIVGALGAGYGGEVAGIYKGQKHYYKKRGLDINLLSPFKPAKFSPEAEEKYIGKFQKKS